jgi:hypothetical protein
MIIIGALHPPVIFGDVVGIVLTQVLGCRVRWLQMRVNRLSITCGLYLTSAIRIKKYEIIAAVADGTVLRFWDFEIGDDVLAISPGSHEDNFAPRN